MSVVSAGCVLWLRVLQPLFVTVAIVALVYQAWLVWRRPPQRRTPRVLLILWSSIAVNGLIFGAWGLAWLRYR